MTEKLYESIADCLDITGPKMKERKKISGDHLFRHSTIDSENLILQNSNCMACLDNHNFLLYAFAENTYDRVENKDHMKMDDSNKDFG